MEAALRNTVVLRKIFSNLPFGSLKRCRLVNKTWNFEAGSYMRDFRRCDAKIAFTFGSPCSIAIRLQAFNEVVSRMDLVVPINSLTMRFPSFHPNCTSISGIDFSILEELIGKLPLKYLSIRWNNTPEPWSCLANRFAARVFKDKLMELYKLELDSMPEELGNYFLEDWTPPIPKLTAMTVGIQRELIQSPAMDFILKIINGAPNLKKIKWHGFDGDFMQVFPLDKYALLDGMDLVIRSAEEERNWLQLDNSGPSLSNLTLTVPSFHDRRYIRSFLRVLEMLLTSSCKTLEKLHMGNVNFPFSLINFPPLLILKNFWILSTELRQEQLINILRSVDYPRLFPGLENVSVQAGVDEDLQQEPWLYDDAARLELRPLTMVQHLSVTANFDTAILQDLGELFPNARDLRATPLIAQPTSIRYAELWATWPHLHQIWLTEGGVTWRNFDAEFLGIYPEEIEMLRELDDESLEKMHIVPPRPSILTLPGKIYNMQFASSFRKSKVCKSLSMMAEFISLVFTPMLQS